MVDYWPWVYRKWSLFPELCSFTASDQTINPKPINPSFLKFFCKQFFFLFHSFNLLQANKAGRSYKLPLSTFYVEEITHHVNPLEYLLHWEILSKKEVKLFGLIVCSLCLRWYILLCAHHIWWGKNIFILFKKHIDNPVVNCRYAFLLTLEYKVVLFISSAKKTKVIRICADSIESLCMKEAT